MSKSPMGTTPKWLLPAQNTPNRSKHPHPAHNTSIHLHPAQNTSIRQTIRNFQNSTFLDITRLFSTFLNASQTHRKCQSRYWGGPLGRGQSQLECRADKVKTLTFITPYHFIYMGSFLLYWYLTYAGIFYRSLTCKIVFQCHSLMFYTHEIVLLM